ncbi:hypothetical protein L3D26_02985 [Moraxella sp. ZY21109]|uniref:hypothetical protein n=1 Tax=Moraxella sp. ZY21109 TaxID=2911969 RepID=UPI003D7DEE3A
MPLVDTTSEVNTQTKTEIDVNNSSTAATDGTEHNTNTTANIAEKTDTVLSDVATAAVGATAAGVVAHKANTTPRMSVVQDEVIYVPVEKTVTKNEKASVQTKETIKSVPIEKKEAVKAKEPVKVADKKQPAKADVKKEVVVNKPVVKVQEKQPITAKANEVTKPVVKAPVKVATPKPVVNKQTTANKSKTETTVKTAPVVTTSMIQNDKAKGAGSSDAKARVSTPKMNAMSEKTANE